MSETNFEYFDPEVELCTFDDQGRPVRPRKKPGRKPNPPSPAQRKAQNRAAQRAFRERKRREMREAESTVKHCLYIRDQALEETRRVKSKLEEVRYENNYLKGQLLTLKMACIANRVDVPKLWDMASQKDGISTTDSIALSKTKDIPQPMEIFLDKHRNVISLSQHNVPSANVAGAAASLTSLSPGPSPHHSPDSFVCSPPSTMVDLHQHETNSLLSSSPGSSYSGSNGCDDILDTNHHQQQQEQHSDTATATTNDLHSSSPSSSPSRQTSSNGTMDLSQQLSLIAPQLASHLDSPFFQQLLNTDLASGLMNDSPSPTDNNNNTFVPTGESDPPLGMNHWLQQQNLHPKHLAAVVQAISRNSVGNATPLGNKKDDTDTPMDDHHATTKASSSIKQEQQQSSLFSSGSLDDSLQPGNIAGAASSGTETNDMAGMMNLDALMMDDNNSPSSPLAAAVPELDAKTGLERNKTKVMDEEEDRSTANLLSLSASKLKSAPPMSPLEALHYIRTVKNLESDTQPLFKPTELQRMIPHDTRIDHIPGPMMRDLMILFQDFYNGNELFDLLLASATFLGGDVSNPDNWMVAPSFLHQYWFLCPNHRPHRLDNLVDIVVGMGQDMIKMMMERKAMYFERDRFNDYFPSDLPSTTNQHQQQQPSSSPPSSSSFYAAPHEDPHHVSLAHHQQRQQQQQQQHDHELQPSGKNLMTFDAFNGNDFSLDAMMTLVNDNDLFASM
ncbi:hypothetical protein BCR42DRAFT_457132 [Absidia repens]|uniref:BZIP domain-containing protein n=1 Tax=Absidia repens TaxID=90262 RepID=A0A1X2HXJ5_9FUNG|nr:hypothetical protein BCR42DRAFT_457132 [Absidia repens]